MIGGHVECAAFSVRLGMRCAEEGDGASRGAGQDRRGTAQPHQLLSPRGDHPVETKRQHTKNEQCQSEGTGTRAACRLVSRIGPISFSNSFDPMLGMVRVTPCATREAGPADGAAFRPHRHLRRLRPPQGLRQGPLPICAR
eukprot:3292041-Rhodomonas_salina.1